MMVCVMFHFNLGVSRTVIIEGKDTLFDEEKSFCSFEIFDRPYGWTIFRFLESRLFSPAFSK